MYKFGVVDGVEFVDLFSWLWIPWLLEGFFGNALAVELTYVVTVGKLIYGFLGPIEVDGS